MLLCEPHGRGQSKEPRQAWGCPALQTGRLGPVHGYGGCQQFWGPVTGWQAAPAETSWGAPGSRGSGQPSWSSSVIVPILPPGKAARVPAPTQQVHQGGCWDPAG